MSSIPHHNRFISAGYVYILKEMQEISVFFKRGLSHMFHSHSKTCYQALDSLAFRSDMLKLRENYIKMDRYDLFSF